MPGKSQSVHVVLNLDKLKEIEREMPGRAEEVIAKLAKDCERDMKENMSANSPSMPGEPPAVVTGALKSSIVAIPVLGEDLAWQVVVGGPNANYAVHLEYGTENADGHERMAARPFVLPSVRRIANNIPAGLLKRVVGDD